MYMYICSRLFGQLICMKVLFTVTDKAIEAQGVLQVSSYMYMYLGEYRAHTGWILLVIDTQDFQNGCSVLDDF